MEKELTSYLLHYLLENCFESKADMARKLDMNKRVLQRILNDAEHAKGGTITLDKALCYCARHGIPLDHVLTNFFVRKKDSTTETEGSMKLQSERTTEAAYTHLALLMPDSLSPEGAEVFHSMLQFIQQASAHICPNCTTWCNPWDGSDKLTGGACYLARMAQYISKDVAELYGERRNVE